jgi:hypothetical protein
LQCESFEQAADAPRNGDLDAAGLPRPERLQQLAADLGGGLTTPR